MSAIYIAAKYSRRDELRTLAAQLRADGHTVTSSWLDEHQYPLNVKIGDVQPTELQEIAIRDVQDIGQADTFLFMAEDGNNQPPRGGRHVEFGIALESGKRIVVVGERENVFHHLPVVTCVPTLERARELLRQ